MSWQECHAPTISSVIFIYAHAMVYINLQFTKVSVHFFSLFGAVRRWKTPKNVQKWRLCFEKRFLEFFWSAFSPNVGKYEPEKLRIRHHILRSYCYYSWRIFWKLTGKSSCKISLDLFSLVMKIIHNFLSKHSL